eukprot:TRINITY_DN4714_c0_g1_i2.p1 TRINITY_DN4714_c0_g1~~TRINITY_DN4714_c0_g1_i2.p1  ORF type:complete len:513 (-),score=154.10 TRINITY_DN4714_c0_g1_i2:292-1830(-)
MLFLSPVSAALAILFVLAVAAYFVLYPRWYFRSLKDVPGPPVELFLGTMRKVLTGKMTSDTALEDDLKFMHEYQHLYRRWFFFIRPFLTVCSGEAAKSVLRTPDAKSIMYNLLLPWLGEGLLISQGPRWKKHRRLLTPAFHYNILRGYVPVFVRHCEVMLDKWSRVGPEEEIDAQHYIHSLTLDIIGECAFGYSINSQNETSEYARAIFRCTELFVQRVFNVLHRYDWMYHLSAPGKEWLRCVDIVRALPDQVIHDRIEQRNKAQSEGAHQDSEEEEEEEEAGGKTYRDFLDILLDATTEDGGALSLTDVRDEVNTFMFEGHDTTGSGLTWALYVIAKHPEVQQRIVDELNQVLGERTAPEDMNEVSRLTYLSAVLKETLRMYPPVPFISRTCEETSEIMGVKIPKGTQVSVSVRAIHFNPLHWDEPDEFRPERFLESDASQQKHAFAYMPFSAGPRNCIGQKFAQLEEMTVLAIVLKRFKLSLVEKQNVLPVFSTVLRPKHGIKLFVEPRQ